MKDKHIVFSVDKGPNLEGRIRDKIKVREGNVSTYTNVTRYVVSGNNGKIYIVDPYDIISIL